MVAVSRKTYAIEDSGPYDEDEVREKIPTATNTASTRRSAPR